MNDNLKRPDPIDILSSIYECNLALYWINISSDGRHPLTVSVGGSRSNESSHSCISF